MPTLDIEIKCSRYTISTQNFRSQTEYIKENVNYSEILKTNMEKEDDCLIQVIILNIAINMKHSTYAVYCTNYFHLRHLLKGDFCGGWRRGLEISRMPAR